MKQPPSVRSRKAEALPRSMSRALTKQVTLTQDPVQKDRASIFACSLVGVP